MTIGKFSENKFKSEHHVLLFHAHLQFRIQYEYGMGLVQAANKGYWRHFVFFVHFLCHFYA